MVVLTLDFFAVQREGRRKGRERLISIMLCDPKTFCIGCNTIIIASILMLLGQLEPMIDISSYFLFLIIHS